MNVQIDVPVTHHSPVGTITGTGVRAITAIMGMTDVRTHPDWVAANVGRDVQYLPELPNDWPWVWMVTQGRYRGTFAKRVRQYLYAEHGVIAPEPWLAAIGQIARAHSASRLAYQFVVTRELYWRAGDYGDYGSCIMHANSHALQAMADAGVYAMRFHHADGTGYARAWLMPYGDGFVLWNGYGLPLVEIARVLAEYLGVDYASCRVNNNGDTDGVVWVNGGRGYFVAPCADEAEIDLGIEDGVMCQFCDQHVSHDDAVRVNDG